MRRVSGGYTILEVSITLAISIGIAASAWSLISGRQAETDFNQKMRETQSKLQQWMSDVSNGATNGDPSNQNCVVSSSHRPQIKSGGPSSAPDCTFLGKAIQFTDSTYAGNQDQQLFVYSVFGCRVYQCSATRVDFPQDMLSANPEPAIGGISVGTPNASLTETFDLSPAYVKSVCSVAICSPVPPQNTQSHLIGFMNSFNTEQNSAVNGSENLSVYLYSLNASAAPATDVAVGGSVQQCIEGLSAACRLNSATPNPPSLTSYKFCLRDGKRSAQITISSASGIGASTHLDYITC